MTRATRNPIDRLVRTLYLALPFAAIACGGDESPSTVPSAEARSVTPVASVDPVAPSTPVETGSPGSDVTRPTTFETAGDAYKAGDYRVATEMYKAKVGASPADAYGHYMLGLSSWKSGDFSGANDAFDKAIALDPKFAKAWFNQARVLLDLERVPEALELIEKGRAIDSTAPDGLRLLARAKAEGGDREGAIATYRELLVRDEGDAWGLNNLGMLMFEDGDVTGALGPLARAVQVKPTAPLFLNNLGMALERSGHMAAALRRYELAVQHDSTYVKAVKNAERLEGLVKDSTLADEVDVQGLAEQFRLTVRSWKVDVPKP